MTVRTRILAAAFLAVLAGRGRAESPAPVRLGTGAMTFETVPGWGLDEHGKSQIGPTHGGVVVDKAGNVYTSSDLGIFVFAPDGRLIRRFLGDGYTGWHDIEIRTEGADEFLYGARNAAGEGIKVHAVSGDVVLRLGIPTAAGLDMKKWSPTAITVAPNGDIFLADGYASNRIFKFATDGTYIKHFGAKGNGLQEFNTAHGMTLDTRYDPPRLLICDRNHGPSGRLVHYDLDGGFVGEVIGGLGMPTSAAVRGDHVSVPDLNGRVVILDKANAIVAVLGDNGGKPRGANYNIPQDKWTEGVFAGTHGSSWDKDGNLYVQDWNVAGRIMKLARAK